MHRIVVAKLLYPMARNRGFTLIEVIVIITLGALIAAMIAPFLGTAMIRSSEPANRITAGFDVNKVIENIVADYRDKVSNKTLDLIDFNDNLSSKFDESGVTVTGKWITFDTNDAEGKTSFVDTNGDTIFDPQDTDPPDSSGGNLLLVTAVKNNQSLSILLGD